MLQLVQWLLWLLLSVVSQPELQPPLSLVLLLRLFHFALLQSPDQAQAVVVLTQQVLAFQQQEQQQFLQQPELQEQLLLVQSVVV
ncbi:hypothetical protein D3C75_996090 [compost metagenome]